MEYGSHTLGWIRIRARPWTEKNCCKEIYFIHHTSIPTLQPCFTAAAAAFLFEALCLMCTAAAILLHSDSVRGTINNQQQAAKLCWFAGGVQCTAHPKANDLELCVRSHPLFILSFDMHVESTTLRRNAPVVKFPPRSKNRNLNVQQLLLAISRSTMIH